MSFLAKVKKKESKIWRYIAIAAAVITVIVIAVIVVRNVNFFYKKKDTHQKIYKLSDEMNAVVSDSDMQRGYMYSRTTKLLMEDRGSEPWILDWYVMPGTTRSVPGYQSQYIDTYNQVLLLESYVLEGKKSAAEKLMKAIDSQLFGSDGYLLEFAEVSDVCQLRNDATIYESNDLYEDPEKLYSEENPSSYGVTTAYLRVLMDYYEKWGDEILYTSIVKLAEKVFETPSMTCYTAADRAAKPTPYPVGQIIDDPVEPEQDEEPKLISQTGIEISGVDLLALKRASALTGEYEEEYEKLEAIVEGGFISETLPLYAWMYIGEDAYTYYAGSEPSVDLVSSLYTIVHLAEVGKMDERSYAWIKSQIYNKGFLYTQYDIFSGEEASSVEAYEAYPLVLYLAAIKGDSELFELTYTYMMRQYATLDTSQVLYTIFRDTDDSRIAVYARENLLLEIILR